MTPQKKKVVGFIAIGVGLAVAVGSYLMLRPKKPTVAPSNGPGNGSGTGSSHSSGSGNTPAPTPAPAPPKAGDKLIAGKYAIIYPNKVLGPSNMLGTIPVGDTIGAFILKEGDWIYVAKLPSANYPPNTPYYFYIYKSAEYKVIPI